MCFLLRDNQSAKTINFAYLAFMVANACDITSVKSICLSQKNGHDKQRVKAVKYKKKYPGTP